MFTESFCLPRSLLLNQRTSEMKSMHTSKKQTKTLGVNDMTRSKDVWLKIASRPGTYNFLLLHVSFWVQGHLVLTNDINNQNSDYLLVRSSKQVIQKAQQTNRSKEFSKAATNENILGKKNH